MIISRNCVYHATLPARVVDLDEYNELLKTGEWFSNPLLISTKEANKNGKESKEDEGHQRVSGDQGYLRDPHVDSSHYESSSHEDGRRTSSEDLRESQSPIKKRGRPKKG
jgi:hypothetical protein